MAFEMFQSKINALIARAGGKISVKYSIEDGRFFARCSDGTTISSNSACSKVRVAWGSGHVAHVAI